MVCAPFVRTDGWWIAITWTICEEWEVIASWIFISIREYFTSLQTL